ncbi:uncharacterized protein LOC134350161 isoform X2 [Mobula hypostoma]|uniref:uncharacterized protein LOC134350161 isoform X2 n=1 Tax=Mobula hypostoma TaxID=723540 RepID=UPI002FC3A04A
MIRILEEIREVQKDIKQQQNNIKSELVNVNQKIAVVETRIEKVDDRVQNVEQILSKMIKILTQKESKLLDQDGRSRQENIRIYNVPKGAEGLSMMDFVDKLLWEALEIPPTMEIEIERAHRSLVPRPSGDGESKPRSIVLKFLRFKSKVEILRRAWGHRRGVAILISSKLNFEKVFEMGDKEGRYILECPLSKTTGVGYIMPYKTSLNMKYP